MRRILKEAVSPMGQDHILNETIRPLLNQYNAMGEKNQGYSNQKVQVANRIKKIINPKNRVNGLFSIQELADELHRDIDMDLKSDADEVIERPSQNNKFRRFSDNFKLEDASRIKEIGLSTSFRNNAIAGIQPVPINCLSTENEVLGQLPQSGGSLDDFRQQPSVYLHQMKKSLPDKFVQVRKFSKRDSFYPSQRNSSPNSPIGKDINSHQPKLFEDESLSQSESEDAVMDEFDNKYEELAVPAQFDIVQPRTQNSNELVIAIARTAQMIGKNINNADVYAWVDSVQDRANNDELISLLKQNFERLQQASVEAIENSDGNMLAQIQAQFDAIISFQDQPQQQQARPSLNHEQNLDTKLPKKRSFSDREQINTEPVQEPKESTTQQNSLEKQPITAQLEIVNEEYEVNDQQNIQRPLKNKRSKKNRQYGGTEIRPEEKEDTDIADQSMNNNDLKSQIHITSQCQNYQSSQYVSNPAQEIQSIAQTFAPIDDEFGPLPLFERQQKILRFIAKKSQKSLSKKFTYECRKQVAEKRLRIKGRFVTKKQAFEILGLKEDEVKNNECLQRMLEQHYNLSGKQIPYSSMMSQVMNHQMAKESGIAPIQGPFTGLMGTNLPQKGSQSIQVNSLVQNANGQNKLIKIRNFQALFDALPQQFETERDQNMASNEVQNNSATADKMSIQGPPSFGGKEPAFDKSASDISADFIYQRAESQQLIQNKNSMNLSVQPLSFQISETAYHEKQMSIISLQENLKNQDETDQLDGFIQPIFRIERCSNMDDMSSAYGMEEGSSQSGGI